MNQPEWEEIEQRFNAMSSYKKAFLLKRIEIEINKDRQLTLLEAFQKVMYGGQVWN